MRIGLIFADKYRRNPVFAIRSILLRYNEKGYDSE